MVREDVVLVAANNLLVVLVGEDVVAPGEEVGAAWDLAARILPCFLLFSLFLFLGKRLG